MGIGITEYDKKGKEIVTDFDIEIGPGIEIDPETNISMDKEEIDSDKGEMANDNGKSEDSNIGNTTIEEPNDKVEHSKAGNIIDNVDSDKVETFKDNDVAELSVNAATIESNEKGLESFIPQGTIRAQQEVTHEQMNQIKKDAMLRQICPEPGVYDKNKIIPMMNTIEMQDREGAFRNADILAKVMQQSGIPLEINQNIIIKDEVGYTVYFATNSQTYTIPENEFDTNKKQDILNAKNVEELKDIISRDKAMAFEEDNKAVLSGRNVTSLQQAETERSNEITK